MADAAAARREARRKKILANSHNRLQLISGKSGDDSTRDSPIRTIVAEPDYDTPSVLSSHSWACPNNGSITAVLESLDSLSTEYHHDTSTDSEEVSSSVISPAPTVKELQSSLLEKIVVCHYDVVLLSIIIQVFHIIISSADSTYFFLPIVIYSVTKIIWFPQDSDSKIGNALRLMNHFSSNRVQRVLLITQYADALFSDVCVYLFATICIQYFYIAFRDTLFT